MSLVGRGKSRARWGWIGAAGALLVSACAPFGSPGSSPGSAPGPAAPPTAAPAAPAELVVVDTAGGLAALDWAAGRTIYQAPNGVATPDWSRIVFVSPPGSDQVSRPAGDQVSAPGARQARLAVLDGRTGAQSSSVDVPDGLVAGGPDGLVASVVSADGRRVALAPPRPNAGAWQPAGRERTPIVVADPSGAVEPRIFDLPGNYEPDAFSSDGRRLFVLEYQPPQAPDRYRVRQLDLASGALSAVGSRSKVPVPEEDMRGTRRMHVLSPDRTTLYTLYTHQPDHLHARDLAAGLTQARGDVHAFVHVLNLAEGWAYCLDLPQPFGLGPAPAHALALSPDGRWLYVADRSTGLVAAADTTQLVVQATANVGADPQAAGGQAAAGVGPDGTIFLGGASEVLAVDPKTLAVQRRLPGAPGGLAVSADGQRLFLGTRDQVLAVDSLTGAELGRVATPGAQSIEHVVHAPGG